MHDSKYIYQRGEAIPKNVYIVIEVLWSYYNITGTWNHLQCLGILLYSMEILQ